MGRQSRGPYLGGIVWAFPNGTGFSETHPDTDGDGFCDEAYIICEDTTDFLPLALRNGTPTPYRPLSVPGRIQAEDHNLGGEGVAYHDTTPGNSGGVYRHDDVDIENAAGLSTPNVGWIYDGEWLTCTAAVHAAGTYLMRASVASPNSRRTITVSFDGPPITTIAVPNTGSFSTASVPIAIPAGIHTLRLTFQGDGQNLDWFEIGGCCPTPPMTTTPTTPVPSGVASFTAAPLTAAHGAAVEFTVTPASGKSVSATWWSFDATAHLNTWNSRSTNPTFFYPSAGTFSPLVRSVRGRHGGDGPAERVHPGDLRHPTVLLFPSSRVPARARPCCQGAIERVEIVDAPAHVADLALYRARGYAMKGNRIRIVTDRPLSVVEVRGSAANCVNMTGATVECCQPRPAMG